MNIAISGKMGSGKTAAAKSIEESEDGFTNLSIADKIKHIGNLHSKELLENTGKLAPLFFKHLTDLFGEISKKEMEELIMILGGIFYSYEPIEGKNRPLLQELGQALVSKKETVWIDFLVDEVVPKFNDKIVVDDVRYPVEVTKLEDNDFFVVRLETDDKVRIQRLKEKYGNIKESWLNHSTETALDNYPFDVVIDNTNLTVEETHREIIRHYNNI
jgi:dephospho-CoA kinase